MSLERLKPLAVFNYFRAISDIPRGSSNEEAVALYLIKFAQSFNLECKRDAENNVLIKKPASIGYEEEATVIIQGHLDMVCVKTESSTHDFEKDAIEWVIKGDYLSAKETTLGADNGIAVAMMMAILESSTLKHPALECLFTTGEENGMIGAGQLDLGQFEGRYLLNLDAEGEGVFIASCAGGVRAKIEIPTKRIKPQTQKQFEIKVNGLLGGHSGIEIHKRRANANIILLRLLDTIRKTTNMELISVFGGEKLNSIPKFARAVICSDDSNQLMHICSATEKALREEYSGIEPTLRLELHPLTETNELKSYTPETVDRIISGGLLIPDGVYSNSAHFVDLVQTSSNFGIITEGAQHLSLELSIRSQLGSEKRYLLSKVKLLSALLQSEFKVISDYPEWPYVKESPLRTAITKLWDTHMTQPAKVMAIHAGLECGILTNQLSNVDMISFGPNLDQVHTPLEHLSISSTARIYEFLIKFLEEAHLQP